MAIDMSALKEVIASVPHGALVEASIVKVTKYTIRGISGSERRDRKMINASCLGSRSA